MREWVSPVYAFFHPTPNIVEIGGWWAHEFKCQAKGCKAKVQYFLDKGCWGEEVLQATDQAKDANEVHTKIVGSFLHNGAELVCWVSKSLHPFEIVEDKGVQSLMKTERPEYYILSPSTVARDVQMSKTYKITCTYQGYPGKVNFTTDGWTLPNHRAFVAVLVHLKLNGKPLTLPLDIIEVAKVHSHSQCIYELFA
ncbi:hypothetical protein BDR06DRAFT_983285 [Suillus hirtellus]|nr:hypothetical protein BDR06DRAFT_983285 [Suillus hirtellus]